MGVITAFRSLPLDLPRGAEICADAAYTDYLFEDTLAEVCAIELIAHRKRNSKRQHLGWVAYLSDRARKRVETTFSQITACFGRSIHAVTPRGFELKIFLTVLAYAIVGWGATWVVNRRKMAGYLSNAYHLLFPGRWTPAYTVVMSDGVWKYIGWERIEEMSRRYQGGALITELREAAASGWGGKLPDDFTVVLFQS